MIQRSLSKILTDKLFKGKAILLIGARQVGKTTLLKYLTAEQENILWLNADEFAVRNLFENVTVERYRTMFGNAKIVIIDEAQRIENIGIKLKLITDQLPEIQLIATGSSAFELANKINEPLTGRKWEYELFPLSFAEMVNHHGYFEEYKHIPIRMIYGYYPDVVNNPGNEKQILHQLTESYLYKDVLEWERIKKPDKLFKLLQALSFQIGSQVSYNELSNLLEIDKNTVEKYIILLEQAKVIFRLSSFSRNLRNELKFSRKIYFYDNGIRNALISNFSNLEMRSDTGALWENFMISERKKFLQYNLLWKNSWFWRTTAQQEIDYIEESDGKLFGFEFKWNPAKKNNITKVFTNNYPDAEVKVIHRDNLSDFLIL